MGMRGRASGPTSNYLRKSQDECPRQRLLINLLAHASLSFPEPSCVMMSQQTARPVVNPGSRTDSPQGKWRQ